MRWRTVARLLPGLGAVAVLFVAGGPSGLAAPAPDTCASEPNPIVCENARPGNPSSEWDVAGMGDPSIQGFATDFSVNDGDEVAFKIKTDALDYRIDIYRMGYYGGAGARKVATIAPSASLPQLQPSCLTDTSTGLVDCGNWAESARWQVPPGAVSGIYFARLVRTDTGGDSHIFFVVRDDDGASDVLFQTSDTTWQAYNRYGGNSLYVGAPAGRAYKVSYNRPFTTREYASPSFVWEDEYPMVRWLERNGYDVSYFSGIDTARFGPELLEHRAFLSVGHDEYWSAEQRTNVEAARNTGVHLGFFSSNEMFWKTRWEPGIDAAAAPYRTLVSYKETKAAAKIDPNPAWTGTWRDARFSPPSDGGRPENAVTGQLFTVDAYRNDPLRVPAEYAPLRLWRNTSVASLTPGQEATFANGIVGHEFDEDVDNGHRPPGLFRLSSTTLDVDEHLIDEGNTYVPGTATHTLTMYRHASGALVFGAGTSQWSWGLDGEHDYFAGADDVTPDPRLQQATVNLLADMTVQPSTLQSGLVAASASTDSTRPQSAITSPAPGTEVHAGDTLVVTGTASDAGGGVVAGVEVSVDGGATWHPATGRQSWSYAWTVSGFGNFQVKSRAVDDTGNLEQAGAGVSVSISCPCSIWSHSAQPGLASASDTKAVNLGLKFRPDVNGYVTGIRYYRGPGNLGTHVGSLWTAGGTLLARATFTGETASGWQQVTFDSPVSVTAGTTYVASYFAPVGGYSLDAFYFSFFDVHNPPLRALADGVEGGNGLFSYATSSAFPTQTNKSSNYWVDVSFDPVLRPDTTAPTVTDAAPADGATAVDNRVDVTVTFSEAMNASSIGSGTFALADAGGSPVQAAVSYDPAARTATLTPTAALAYSAGYTVTLTGGPSGVRDLAGNPLGTSRTWSFTTLAPPVCPCTLWTNDERPATESSSDPKAVEVGVKFRADVPGYVTGVRFYRGPKNTGTHVGSLWTASGTRLARATFTGETATGWQDVVFDAPVPVTADTTYVASYFTPTGGYAIGTGYFATAHSRPPLRALRDGVAGGNGVFLYTNTGAFPTQTSQASNYWVDVTFDTVLRPDTTPPRVAETSPAAGSSGADHRGNVTASFSEAIDASTVNGSSFELRDLGGTLIPSTVTYDSAARKATLDPSVDLAYGTSYVATVKAGVKDTAGNAMAADDAWTFTTTLPKACPCSLWPDSARPATATSTDSRAVELGVKFRSDAAGFISAIRFYKGSTANGGTHTGSLWSATGTRLGQVTFTSEAASGWQTAYFSSPIPIDANTTYVASYFAPLGRYSLDNDYFVAELASPPLRAPQGSNGVFSYGATSLFPTSSNRSSNYWVDVVFERAQIVSTAPGSAIQPGTSTPVATGSGSAIALDFGGVASASTFDDVVGVTNVSAQPQTLRLSVRDVAQLDRATFASTGDSVATLAPGDSTTVSVRTSDRAAGRGSGWIDLTADGLDGAIRSFAATVETAPAPVADLAARPGAAGRIDLSWPASPTTVNLVGYDVYRSAGSGFTKLTVGPVASTTYSDTTTTDGVLYTYVVRAIGTGTTVPESADSPPASATADARPASIQSVSPSPDSIGVPTAAVVRATFDEPMDASTIDQGTVQLVEVGTGALVPRTVAYDPVTDTVTVTPSSSLTVGLTFRATFKGGAGGVADLVGNPLAADYSWTFSTYRPITVTPGTAVQAGTTTRVATGETDTLALDFGLVPSSRTFTGVFTVINTSELSQPLTLEVAGVDQLSWVRFASNGSSAITLAPGESASVSVATSSTVAGYGVGTLTLSANGSEPFTRTYAIQIREAPQAPASTTAEQRPAGAIAVSWAASTSVTNLLGYDVYRSSGGSAYTKRNASPVTGTTYTDTGTNGVTYSYRVRALSTGSPPLASLESPTASAVADSVAPARPTSTVLANGGGTGNAYINLANRSSLSVAVGVGAASQVSDTLVVTLSLNGQSVAKTSPSRNGSGTVVVSGIDATSLPDGRIAISAVARDPAGNVSTARSTANTKDTVAPAIPTANYVDRLSPTADQITGSAESRSTVRATRTAPSAAGPFTTTAGSNGSYTLTVAASAFQTVTYAINATDAAGNTGANRTLTFTTTR